MNKVKLKALIKESIKEARGGRAMRFATQLEHIKNAINILEADMDIENYSSEGNRIGGELTKAIMQLRTAATNAEHVLDGLGWTLKNPRNNPNWQEPVVDGFTKDDIVIYSGDGQEYKIRTIRPEWGKDREVIIKKLNSDPRDLSSSKHVATNTLKKV